MTSRLGTGNSLIFFTVCVHAHAVLLGKEKWQENGIPTTGPCEHQQWGSGLPSWRGHLYQYLYWRGERRWEGGLYFCCMLPDQEGKMHVRRCFFHEQVINCELLMSSIYKSPFWSPSSPPPNFRKPLQFDILKAKTIFFYLVISIFIFKLTYLSCWISYSIDLTGAETVLV